MLSILEINAQLITISVLTVYLIFNIDHFYDQLKLLFMYRPTALSQRCPICIKYNGIPYKSFNFSNYKYNLSKYTTMEKKHKNLLQKLTAAKYLYYHWLQFVQIHKGKHFEIL